MAWDWGSGLSGGLSGAGTGAAIGSMIPVIGTPVGAAIGGLIGLFGGGMQEDPTNINSPYTTDAWDAFTGGRDKYSKMLFGPGGAFSQGTPTVSAASVGPNQYAAGLEGFNPMSAVMDPTAANRYFMGQAPAFQQMAQQNYNWDAAQQQAQRSSDQAIKNIAGQFGNTGAGALRSGAAMQAISEGAINPLLQFEQQRAQMVGDQAGALQRAGMGNITSSFNTAGQLGMQGQGLQLNALQSLLQNEAARNALNAQFQQQAGMAEAEMAFGQQQQQAGILAQLLGQQYSGMLGLGAPEWYMPAGGDMAGGMGTLLDGFAYADMMGAFDPGAS